MLSVKDMVKDGKIATFVCYFAGNLYYETQDGFRFTVPVSDVGNAIFNKQEKALLMMRYIRKQVELNAQAAEAAAASNSE